MKWIVYQTTNQVNQKIYIGMHKTENPDIFDGYIGCGVSFQEPSMYMNAKTPFQYAVRKYGIKNFKRTVLKVFDTAEEAAALEAQLVDSEFIKREDTYNIALGGNLDSYYFPVNQFDKGGKLLKTWDNMQLAAEALGVSRTSINNAKLHKGSCLGYFWSTDDQIDTTEFSYHVGTRTYVYNLDGSLNTICESITEAAHYVDSKENAIYRAVQTSMSHRGYYFSYKLYETFKPKKLPSMRGKTVYIYDLDGNYLTEKLSGKDLQEYFNITSYGVLKQALATNKPYKGVQVSLEKVDKMPPATEFSKNKAKRVGRYSLEGELLQEYESVKAATREYGSGVFRTLNNIQKQTKGFIFKYLD